MAHFKTLLPGILPHFRHFLAKTVAYAGSIRHTFQQNCHFSAKWNFEFAKDRIFPTFRAKSEISHFSVVLAVFREHKE